MLDIEVIREKEVVARKQHYCDTCKSVILPGETYTRQTNIADGEIYEWKNCNHCKETREEAFKYYYGTWGITSMDSIGFYDYIEELKVDFEPRLRE